jgi:hypothetical protein
MQARYAMTNARQVPVEWIAQSGLTDFTPTRSAFKCDDPHVLIALADIEPPKRNAGIALDANGFGRERMMKILEGIRNGASIPPIYVEESGSGQRPYRVRNGVHRYWASVTVGFTHVPADIIERL